MNGEPLTAYDRISARGCERADAAHLLRRAEYGPAEAEIRGASERGLAGTIDSLFADVEEGPRAREIDARGESIAATGNIQDLAAWLVARHVHTTRPLHARMAMFWLNHFATSNQKVNDAALMLGQLRTVEKYALDSFREMLRAISRDPAMIVWLDGDANHKGRPNENYARELMELFTLGVGNYTEEDVKNAARAFTGWHQRRGRFVFDAADHDGGKKTILGSTGVFDGNDVVDLLLKQPAVALFLARKLLREFINDAPENALVEALADEIRRAEFHIGRAMKALLRSGAMFDRSNRRARVKSPMEFVVGTVRALEMRVNMKVAAQAASNMGQRLFEPPSVKGWEGGPAWIDSASMLVRMNAAQAASGMTEDGLGFDAAAFCKRWKLTDAEKAAAFLFELLLDGERSAALANEVEQGIRGKSLEKGVRRAVQLIVASPEYQLA